MKSKRQLQLSLELLMMWQDRDADEATVRAWEKAHKNHPDSAAVVEDVRKQMEIADYGC